LAHGIGAATAPVTSAILKFTDVFVPIWSGSGAKAIGPVKIVATSTGRQAPPLR